MADRPRRLDFVFQKETAPVYFVTFNTHARKPILATDAVHASFVAFCSVAESRGVGVGRYVIMPDHLHLFVSGGPEFILSEWVRMLRRCLSKAIGVPLPHWQEGFFDHLLRSDESYAQKWEYVRQNPVRAGLCAEAGDWKYHGEITLIDRV